MKILKNTIQRRNAKFQSFPMNMIANMLSDKKCNGTVTELFIRGRKLNISLVFITHYFFAVPKILH